MRVPTLDEGPTPTSARPRSRPPPISTHERFSPPWSRRETRPPAGAQESTSGTSTNPPPRPNAFFPAQVPSPTGPVPTTPPKPRHSAHFSRPSNLPSSASLCPVRGHPSHTRRLAPGLHPHPKVLPASLTLDPWCRPNVLGPLGSQNSSRYP